MSDLNKNPSVPVAYSQTAMVEVVGTAEPIHIEGVAAQGEARAPDTMSIPADFIKVGCMACSFNNTQWPTCFGCKGSGTCLCFEGWGSCYKCIDHPEACFLCDNKSIECVMPRTCCKLYNQCFCFECFVSLPPNEDAFKAVPEGLVDVPKPAFVDSAVVMTALCCYANSLNCCPFPTCILEGCYSKGENCCIYGESVGYRCLCWEQNKANPDSLCLIAKGQSYCIMPRTCCKGISRIPGCDYRTACPCDDEVPCVYGPLPFCICCFDGACNCACCVSLESLKLTSARGAANAVIRATQPGAPK